MAPRKRAKAGAASTPLAETQHRSPHDDGDDVQLDPWADEQETQLFKSTMKWKPTGKVALLTLSACAPLTPQASTSTFV